MILNSDAPLSEFEPVYTVNDYWDGPRNGVAAYCGTPHVYQSLFLIDEDEWDAERFRLGPIAPEDFALVLEDWAIWRRFESAYKKGDVKWSGNESEWAALPQELPRHRELADRVKAALRVNPLQALLAVGEFRAPPHSVPEAVGVMRPLMVKWTPVEIVAPVI